MPARRSVAVAVVVVSAALQPSARGSVLRGAAAEPDLVLEARATPERVVTGRNVTFTVTISNEGSDAAIDVTLLDELPPETTFVSCAATGSGKCGGSGLERRVTFDAVRPDATETVTLVAAVMCPLADGEELSNTASIHLPRAPGAGAAAELDDADDVAIAVVTTSNPPPMVSDLTLTPSRQQTDARMIDVTVGYDIVDNCGPVRVALNVSRSDVAREITDRNPPDWEIVDAHHVRLRAHGPAGADRANYTIEITAIDSADQASAPVSRAVTVPPVTR